MDVLEAITSRKSIRAFTDQPVPRETLEKIMEISQRAPSGTNTQPWHIYVCAGDTRDAIEHDVLELAKQGKAAKYEDYDYYPAQWKDIHRDRRRGGDGRHADPAAERGPRRGEAPTAGGFRPWRDG